MTKSILLTNKIGGYALFSRMPQSRFWGVFFHDGNDLFKIIDDIRLDSPLTSIKDRLWSAEFERRGLSQSFFMPLNLNSLVMDFNHQANCSILFDIRKSYDTRSWGKNYEITEEDGDIIIHFTKKTDSREDGTHGRIEDEIFVVIKTDTVDYEKVEEWQKVHYPLDEQRKSHPWETHVFDALRVDAKKVVISFSKHRQQAIREAHYVYTKADHLKRLQQSDISRLIHHKVITKPNIDAAYKCSVNAVFSLHNRINNRGGLYAGLPWFFQFWSRDELISLRALMQIGEIHSAKEIILRYLDDIQPDGRLSNRYPATELQNADSVGWMFKRTADLLRLLRASKRLKKTLTVSNLNFIEDRLFHSLDLIEKYHTHNGFLLNGPQETWMDTDPGVDPRDGARIEMQAMKLLMYKTMFDLTGGETHKNDELTFRNKVRQKFFQAGYLKDGADDATIRPNMFIAAYLYPELLSKEEWTKCFKIALKRLWLPWGGLSTIDQRSPLFKDTYSGENPISYHRGDSWYWLNNLAAIVMHKTDSQAFAPYVDKILNASTKEILQNGIVGYHAELSSAKSASSEGCQAQLWSSAMYVELVNALF